MNWIAPDLVTRKIGTELQATSEMLTERTGLLEPEMNQVKMQNFLKLRIVQLLRCTNRNETFINFIRYQRCREFNSHVIVTWTSSEFFSLT